MTNGQPLDDGSRQAVGQFGTTDFELLFKDGANNNNGKFVSPWHDLPLQAASSSSPYGSGSSSSSKDAFTFVVEIPMFETAKMEVSKEGVFNPIKQDTNKDGSPRYYTYGTPFFNYGLLPQTWEDPENCNANGERGMMHGLCRAFFFSPSCVLDFF